MTTWASMVMVMVAGSANPLYFTTFADAAAAQTAIDAQIAAFADDIRLIDQPDIIMPTALSPDPRIMTALQALTSSELTAHNCALRDILRVIADNLMAVGIYMS